MLRPRGSRSDEILTVDVNTGHGRVPVGVCPGEAIRISEKDNKEKRIFGCDRVGMRLNKGTMVPLYCSPN